MTKINATIAIVLLLMVTVLALLHWWVVKEFRQPTSIPILAQQTVVNVADYGASGADEIDDSLAVQSALNAAASGSSAQGNTRVKVFFPDGRYIFSSQVLVPSNVTLSGSTTGESIIVNSRTGFVFTTRNWNDTWSYLSIARADDTSAHPAVPKNSYKGLNYVYLKDRNDIQALRNLGVPKVVSSAYGGLKSGVASGATLGNNYGTNVPPDSDPKLTLQKDNGVNPTPVNFNNILAVDDTGKVTLKYNNRLNWGVDAHTANESLATYYKPSYSDSYNAIVTGPAWLLPANNYRHDISFENLVFEADTTKSSQLYDIYGLYIGYAYNVSVNNCKFRNLPGAYPILAIRAYNILLKNSQFNVQGYHGVTLDSGSGFRLYNNTFRGGSWPGATSLNLPPEGLNFIEFDELPMDIDIIGNQFFDLKYVSSDRRSGQAIRGPGGAYLKLSNNNFTNIEGAIIQTETFNSNAIVDNNVMYDSRGFLFSGTGAGMVNLYNNRYTGSTKVRTDGAGFDSYNYSGSPTNYACNNYGVTINQWYYPTSYVAANYYQDGTPITSTNLIDVSGYRGAYDAVQVSGNKLNPVEISSINLSASTITVDSQASITVNLSAPTATDFPFYLSVTDGDLDAMKFESFLLHVPAGQQQVTLSQEVLGLKPGVATISAKPLCSTSTQSPSANLSIQ